jgi:hypothetical protein
MTTAIAAKKKQAKAQQDAFKAMGFTDAQATFADALFDETAMMEAEIEMAALMEEYELVAAD